GGGFDVACGLPLYFELRGRGKEVHLASLSFMDFEALDGAIALGETLVGVTAETAAYSPYAPEVHLARWFLAVRNEPVTVWCLGRAGGERLLRDYQLLREHLSYEAILLVDGGVDSLSRGDEE